MNQDFTKVTMLKCWNSNLWWTS